MKLCYICPLVLLAANMSAQETDLTSWYKTVTKDWGVTSSLSPTDNPKLVYQTNMERQQAEFNKLDSGLLAPALRQAISNRLDYIDAFAQKALFVAMGKRDKGLMEEIISIHCPLRFGLGAPTEYAVAQHDISMFALFLSAYAKSEDADNKTRLERIFKRALPANLLPNGTVDIGNLNAWWRQMSRNLEVNKEYGYLLSTEFLEPPKLFAIGSSLESSTNAPSVPPPKP